MSYPATTVRPVTEHQELHRTSIDRVEQLVVTELDGRPHVVIAGAWQTSVWLWDPSGPGDRPDELPLRGAASYTIAQLATAQLDGRPVVVTGGDRHDASETDTGDMGGNVRVWDLASGTMLGQPLTGHWAGIWSLATAVGV